MELQCNFQIVNYTFYTDRGNESGYTCRVKKINYKPNLKTIEIDGDHKDLMDNFDVIGLTIDRIELNKIPFGLTKVFPNLVYLQLRKCGLKTLTKKDLFGLEHLKGLWLPENNIVTLDNDLFENLQGLKYICFRDNKLKFIGSNIFKPLRNLINVNFLGNTCINKSYDAGKDNLNELIEEIMMKCTGNAGEIDDAQMYFIKLQKEVQALKDHVGNLENKIKTLENVNKQDLSVNSRIKQLEQIVSEMQIRLDSMESMH